MKKKKLGGIIAMLVTPFDDEGNINFDALRAELDWCVAQGADGIVAAPSIGEFCALSNEERWSVFQVCHDQARKHSHIYTIAMISSNTVRETLDHAAAAMEIGYDAAQLIPPYYWRPDPSEVYCYYASVARACNEQNAPVTLPIVVYHNPALSKFYMSRKLLSELADIPGIVAIKEVKTDRHVDLEPLFYEVGDRAKIFTTFRAFSTGLVLGSAGGFINVFAVPACVTMWKLWNEMKASDGGALWRKNFLKIEEIQKTLNQTFPRGGEDNERHIGTTKVMASEVAGIPMGPPRAPYMAPEPIHVQRLREELPKLQKLLKSA